MIVAHVMGLPIEESVLQFVPAGAATVTAVALAGRVRLNDLLTRLTKRSSRRGPRSELLMRQTGLVKRILGR